MTHDLTREYGSAPSAGSGEFPGAGRLSPYASAPVSARAGLGLPPDPESGQELSVEITRAGVAPFARRLVIRQMPDDAWSPDDLRMVETPVENGDSPDGDREMLDAMVAAVGQVCTLEPGGEACMEATGPMLEQAVRVECGEDPDGPACAEASRLSMEYAVEVACAEDPDAADCRALQPAAPTAVKAASPLPLLGLVAAVLALQ